jgi:ribosomal protein L40E
MKVKVCRECGSASHVHRGLCRRCRERERGPAGLREGKTRGPEPKPSRSADMKGPRARPWVHKGSGTG